MKASTIKAIAALQDFIAFHASTEDIAKALGNILNEYAAMKGADLTELAEGSTDLAILTDLCQTLGKVTE